MLEGQSCLISRALPSSCEQESKWLYMTYQLLEITNNKRPPSVDPGEPDEAGESKRPRSPNPPSPTEPPEDGAAKSEDQAASSESTKSPTPPGPQGPPVPPEPPVDESDREGDGGGGHADSNSLISPIGRDISMNCLLLCSRSDYGALASLNRSFRSLIRSGELYRLRRVLGITEHWVYFSCSVMEWVAYDPYRNRWINLPRMMPRNDCFMLADKESLAVGTELLVFGKEITSHVVLRYSILTNSWSPGVEMNSPRCLFGSASLGEKAIVAGGTDARGNILDSAELYNSETQKWETLPSMNKPRKMCSGVFMDKKFYVIGGMASHTELLTCGEEYDLEKGTWRVIPNMSAGLIGVAGAPPLVAVVNNELYAADYGEKEVRKYDKENNSWITLGRLPERPDSMNGWGLAFRACGERLIVIGGARTMGGGTIELNSWIPAGGPPEWNIIASRHLGSFVYNCAVMGC